MSNEGLLSNTLANYLQSATRYDLPPWCPKDKVPKVWPALVAVQRDIDAIGKNRRNQDQKYSFRGIDDVFNMLHELLAKHGLTTRPRVLQRVQGDRTTKSGSAMIHVALEVEFWVTDEDGASAIIGPVWGEALDTSDKSTNKAISFAMKYAMLQTFTVPTEDMAEGDRTTPDAGRQNSPPPNRQGPADQNQNTDVIGPTNAAKVYAAFGEHGITREQLHRKLDAMGYDADVAKAPAAMLQQLRLWKEAIANDKRKAVEIFGANGASSKAAEMNK